MKNKKLGSSLSDNDLAQAYSDIILKLAPWDFAINLGLNPTAQQLQDVKTALTDLQSIAEQLKAFRPDYGAQVDAAIQSQNGSVAYSNLSIFMFGAGSLISVTPQVKAALIADQLSGLIGGSASIDGVKNAISFQPDPSLWQYIIIDMSANPLDINQLKNDLTKVVGYIFSSSDASAA